LPRPRGCFAPLREVRGVPPLPLAHSLVSPVRLSSGGCRMLMPRPLFSGPAFLPATAKAPLHVFSRTPSQERPAGTPLSPALKEHDMATDIRLKETLPEIT